MLRNRGMQGWRNSDAGRKRLRHRLASRIKWDRGAMLGLALRNIKHGPARAALTVLAVAALLAEILVLEGFMAGSYTQLRQGVLRRGGDVIVAQSGITNFLAARSILPQQTRAEVEAIPGVAATYPLAVIALIYEREGLRTPIIMLVHDNAGGPDRIIVGSAPQSEREIVIDRSLSQRYDLAPGDILKLADFEFRISGITQGNAALFTPFAFITFDGLIDFYFESDVATDIAAFPLLSFLAVEAEPGIDPVDLAAAITARLDAAHGVLPQVLARNDENLGRDLIGPVLTLLLGLSYAAGAMAIGMFMYAAVRSRRKSFGVLRALGLTPGRLAAGVVAEALATALAAIPLGILLALGLKALIEGVAPVYLLQVLEPTALLRTSAIALGLAVIGGLAPLPMLMRLDPATAFRG